MFYNISPFSHDLYSMNMFVQREGFTLLKPLFIAFLLKAISHPQSDLLDLVGFSCIFSYYESRMEHRAHSIKGEFLYMVTKIAKSLEPHLEIGILAFGNDQCCQSVQAGRHLT